VPDDFDVIVFGTGAGGGTVAQTLAQTGKRILLLERGTFLTRETDNWASGPVFIDGHYIPADTWYDQDGTPFQPQVHYFVGGAELRGAGLVGALIRGWILTELAAERGTSLRDAIDHLAEEAQRLRRLAAVSDVA
jgi:choline dehydrogenase-like flavoprotein